MTYFKLILLLLGSTLTEVCFAQSTGKLYGSIEDYRTDHHHVDKNLFVEFRTDIGILVDGGNWYRVHSSDKSKEHTFKYGYWAVEINDSLFLNGYRLSQELGYVLAARKDNKLFFLGSTTTKESQLSDTDTATAPLSITPVLGGVAGGLLGHAERPFDRCHYFLNLDTEEIKYVNENEMLELLKPHPDLSEQYAEEKYPEHNETIEKYLTELKLRETD